MKKILILSLLILVFIGVVYFNFPFSGQPYHLRNIFLIKNPAGDIAGAFNLLKARMDSKALLVFEKILYQEPGNPDALWGKAEVLRRARKYQAAEELLRGILGRNPEHVSSLVSLAYLKYAQGYLNDAERLINKVFSVKGLDRENEAIAYLVLGGIKNKYYEKANLLRRFQNALQIKNYFLKAKKLAPDLPETHLGLGVFYLLAPGIAGGSLDKAIQELEFTVKIAPEFATACARLAQAYSRKGDNDKFIFYVNRAIALDPENEALKEFIDSSSAPK